MEHGFSAFRSCGESESKERLRVGLEHFGHFRGLRSHDYRRATRIYEEWLPLLARSATAFGSSSAITRGTGQSQFAIAGGLADGPHGRADVEEEHDVEEPVELEVVDWEPPAEELEVIDLVEEDEAADEVGIVGEAEIEEGAVAADEAGMGATTIEEDTEEGVVAADEAGMGEAVIEEERVEVAEGLVVEAGMEEAMASRSFGEEEAAVFPPPVPELPLPPQPVVQHIYIMVPPSSSQAASSSSTQWPSRPGDSRRSRSRSGAPRQRRFGWCRQCHMDKSQCYKLGDWECPSCGQHNYASRSMCTNTRCSSRQEDGELWCKSCKSWRRICFKPGDWACRCGNHNYSSKQARFKDTGLSGYRSSSNREGFSMSVLKSGINTMLQSRANWRCVVVV